jgi:hypothetical protein
MVSKLKIVNTSQAAGESADTAGVRAAPEIHEERPERSTPSTFTTLKRAWG